MSITDKSGADGVAVWVNEFFGLRGEERINKIKVVKIFEKREHLRIPFLKREKVKLKELSIFARQLARAVRMQRTPPAPKTTVPSTR